MKQSEPAECRNCGFIRKLRPRGLCGRCYSTPEIYAKYKAEKPQNNLAYQTPAEPTDAFPGSDEKIAIMSARLSRGESAFHPNDLDLRTVWDGCDDILRRVYEGRK